MGELRFNQIPNTAISTNQDDFIPIDGTASGTRKILPTNLTVGNSTTSSFSQTSAISLSASFASTSTSASFSQVSAVALSSVSASFSSTATISISSSVSTTAVSASYSVKSAGVSLQTYSTSTLNSMSSASAAQIGFCYCSDCIIPTGTGSVSVFNGTQWVTQQNGYPLSIVDNNLTDQASARAALGVQFASLQAGQGIVLSSLTGSITQINTIIMQLTTSQIAGLTNAQSAAIGTVYCTDCFNPTGNLGASATWTGTTWIQNSSGISLTTDPLTFFRSLATSTYIAGNYYNGKISRWDKNPVTNNSGYVTTNGGAQFISTVTSTPISGIQTFYQLSSGTTSGSAQSSYVDFQPLFRPQSCPYTYRRLRVVLQSGASATSSNAYNVRIGWEDSGTNATATTLGANYIGLIYDPANTFGLNSNNSGSWFAHTRYASVDGTPQFSGSVPSFVMGSAGVFTGDVVELFWNNSVPQMYLNNTLIATFAPNAYAVNMVPVVRNARTLGSSSYSCDICNDVQIMMTV